MSHQRGNGPSRQRGTRACRDCFVVRPLLAIPDEQNFFFLVYYFVRVGNPGDKQILFPLNFALFGFANLGQGQFFFKFQFVRGWHKTFFYSLSISPSILYPLSRLLYPSPLL